MKKFYPANSSSQELAQLESQLLHFQLDVCNHPELMTLTSIAGLTKGLVKTGKASSYPMVAGLLRLVITLPVSTATAEWAFSAMKIVKTRR
uniref:HAT C-terminal dimerisation domain-containing protein n=1 Tax=Triticum urartu TaxID=4572 RepID=A0A8R7RET8_TRIUA